MPKIHKAMEANGSWLPIFETDEESHYFLIVLPIQPEASRKTAAASKNTLVDETTHPYTGVFPIEALPLELQKLINKLNRHSSISDLRLLIQKLCAWQPLTAQQLIDLLKRKDKKHFVRSHLTPMIKEGILKYLFPEDEDSPSQAYTCKKQGYLPK